MKRILPYLKMISKTNLLYFPVILIIGLGIDWINLFLNILSDSYIANIVDGNLIFSSNMYFAMPLILFIMAIRLSTSEFNIAMNIKSDRKSYIKAVLLYLMFYSLLLVVINMILEFIIVKILSYSSGLDVLIMDNTSIFAHEDNLIYTTIKNIAFMLGIQFSGVSTIGIFYQESNLISIIVENLDLWVTLIMYSSIGLFIGAFSYRLKKIITLIVFISIPVLGIGYVVSNVVLGKEEFIQYLLNDLFVDILIFNSNNLNVLILKLFIIIISIMSFILLLKKAPIKEYAHDLL